MEYTENLELPICEDTDNGLNILTQGNEIANKVEEKLGTYDDTVEALTGLTTTVNDLNTDYENFKVDTSDNFTDVNTSINNLDTTVNAINTRIVKLENGVINSNVLDSTKNLEYYALNFSGVANLTPSTALQSNIGINTAPLNPLLNLTNGDKVQILAITPVTGTGVTTVNTSGIISVPNTPLLFRYGGFAQAPTTNGLRIQAVFTNQWDITDTVTYQNIGVSVLVAVEREV